MAEVHTRPGNPGIAGYHARQARPMKQLVARAERKPRSGGRRWTSRERGNLGENLQGPALPALCPIVPM